MITPDQLLKNRTCQTQLAADAANVAANALAEVVLHEFPSMMSEVSIAREAATLLQHAGQNLNRIALKHLQDKGGSG